MYLQKSNLTSVKDDFPWHGFCSFCFYLFSNVKSTSSVVNLSWPLYFEGWIKPELRAVICDLLTLMLRFRVLTNLFSLEQFYIRPEVDDVDFIHLTADAFQLSFHYTFIYWFNWHEIKELIAFSHKVYQVYCFRLSCDRSVWINPVCFL